LSGGDKIHFHWIMFKSDGKTGRRRRVVILVFGELGYTARIMLGEEFKGRPSTEEKRSALISWIKDEERKRELIRGNTN